MKELISYLPMFILVFYITCVLLLIALSAFTVLNQTRLVKKFFPWFITSLSLLLTISFCYYVT